jgi:hypothetical protein
MNDRIWTGTDFKCGACSGRSWRWQDSKRLCIQGCGVMGRIPIPERIHPTHTVKHDPNTITGLHGDRFGQTWDCEKCEAHAHSTNGGDDIDHRFEEPCPYGDRKLYLSYQIAKTKTRLNALELELSTLEWEGEN